ncbi:type 1 fimbrial protein [Pseudomonas gingeri]|uniref:Type 1 fimbrial protein n=1 Tax=Pseudomonas gingeri TaxID=117681 RepID=A0A7Y7XA68_9PSED|nr:fimbrial protein [Pseudomonas gingeri]NWB96149.1 type 1 fimbrial protein [Pseudomonas gingeri]
MKTPLFVSLLAAAATITGTAQAVQTGSLRFTGNIEGGTCHLATSDVSRTIELPQVKVSDFDSTTWAGLKTFDLTANCDSDIRNVTFTFSGTADAFAPTRFANVGGTARGVATVIQSRIGGTAYNFPANGNATERSRTIPTTAGRAVIPMGAHYIKTSISGVTKGTLLTTANVTITYN